MVQKLVLIVGFFLVTALVLATGASGATFEPRPASLLVLATRVMLYGGSPLQAEADGSCEPNCHIPPEVPPPMGHCFAIRLFPAAVRFKAVLGETREQWGAKHMPTPTVLCP